jgi:hypothetical protein
MPGVLGTAAKGTRLLAVVIVGVFVMYLFAPAILGVLTGVVGLELPTKVVGGIALLAGLFVMGRLA